MSMHSLETSPNRGQALSMKVLVALFLLTAMFPYTQLLPLDTYTQPYSFLMGGLLFVMVGWRQVARIPPLDGWALLFFAGAGLIFFVVDCLPKFNMQEIKYLLMYVSPLVFATTFFYVQAMHTDLTKRLVELSALCWLLVGLVQVLFDATFATFTVGEWQAAAQIVVDSGRGVLSLAPEPTHFGFHMVLMGALLYLIDGNRYLVVACLLAALLLAKSSSVLMALVIGIALTMLTRPAFFLVSAGLSAILLPLTYVAVQDAVESGPRLLYLLRLFIQDPYELLSLDRSVNTRLGGLIAAAWTILDQGFWPHGLSHLNWEQGLSNRMGAFPWLNSLSESGWPSGYLIVIYQSGLIGLAFLGLVFYRFLLIPIGMFQKMLLLGAFSIFFLQYYISVPTFGVIYGALIFRLSQNWHIPRAKIRTSVQTQDLLTTTNQQEIGR